MSRAEHGGAPDVAAGGRKNGETGCPEKRDGRWCKLVVGHAGKCRFYYDDAHDSPNPARVWSVTRPDGRVVTRDDMLRAAEEARDRVSSWTMSHRELGAVIDAVLAEVMDVSALKVTP